MRAVGILIGLYATLSIYAGFIAQYRDIEDVCNQASHVVICFALLVACWANFQVRVLCIGLVILTFAELIDECLKNNVTRHADDYIFPLLTCAITMIILWKFSKNN